MREEFDIGYTTMGLVIDENNVRRGAIDFMLFYRKTDPLVVTIFIKHGMTVGRWEVSRDLLVKGILYNVPTGEGDFRIEAFTSKVPDDIQLQEAPNLLFTFKSSDEDGEYSTRIVVRHHICKEFTEKTIEVMPRSLEMQAYDIDDVVRRLLET